MTTPEEAAEQIRTKKHGPEIIEGIATLAKTVPQRLKDQGSSMAVSSMVLSFLGADAVSDLTEKNALLFLNRLLQYAQKLDTLPLEEKVSSAIDAVIAVVNAVQDWDRAVTAATAPLHDKDERRKRRHHIHLLEKEDLQPKVEDVVKKFQPVFLPKGGESLYLPMASFFQGAVSRTIETMIPTVAAWIIREILDRDAKDTIVCRSFAWVELWIKTAKGVCIPDLTPPDDYIQRMNTVYEPCVRIFTPTLLPYLIAMPKDRVSAKLVSAISLFLHTNSIESIVLEGVRSLVSVLTKSSVIVPPTEQVIEKISRDDKFIRGLVSRFVPMPSLSFKREEGKTPIEMFFSQGLKPLMDLAFSNSSSLVDWKELLYAAMMKSRYFVLSPYCDRVLLDQLLLANPC